MQDSDDWSPGLLSQDPGPPQAALRIWRALLRHWWVPLISAVAAVGVAVAYGFGSAAEQTAVARMWVGGTLRTPEGAVFTEELSNLFGTQKELMGSERIRIRAHERVAADHPRLGDEPPEIKVLQPRDTSIFELRVKGTDAGYLVDFLNAVMDEYLAYRREAKAAASQEALTSLMTELDHQEQVLVGAERATADFQSTNDVVVLEEEGVRAGNYLARLQLDLAQLRLESDLLGAVAEQDLPRGASASGATVVQGLGLGVPDQDWMRRWAGNQSAHEYVQALKVQRDDLAGSLRPKHPRMIRLEEEIARGERLLTALNADTSEQLRRAHATLEKRIESIERSVRQWEGRVLDITRRTAELDRLKSAEQRARELHDRFRELVHSLDVNQRLEQVTVSILDHAGLLPSSRGWQTWAFLGGAFGLLSGLGGVFLLGLSDERIRSPEDLLSRYPGAILGVIPRVPGKGREPLPVVEPDDSRTAFVEGFRRLRSALLFRSPAETRPRTLLVSSAVAGEGKTTVALNLARMLALAGSRVLLIDGDLRQGTLTSRLSQSGAPGLGDFIAGRASRQEVCQGNGLPNFALAPVGLPLSSPGEIFLHRRFDLLVEECLNDFDWILIDGAPVLTEASASTLAPRVDGVLLVVHSGQTGAGLLNRALADLVQRQTNVLGWVLNRAEPGDGTVEGRSA